MSNYRRYYIENSYVFITIVTNNRIPILTENIDILKNAIHSAKYQFKVVAGVVLPDHIHIIIHPQNIEELPKIISSIKHTFSKNINFEKTNKKFSEINRREKGIWQRRYYDHIIRDEKDFCRHVDYIHYNPVKHNLVNAAKDWDASSFHKFVTEGIYEIDWCNLNDNNKINSMNIE